MKKASYQQTVLNRFVQVCIVLGMLAGIGLAVFLYVKLPSAIAAQKSIGGEPKWQMILSAALITLSLAGGEIIAFQLLCMMRTLDEDPFVERNVRSLRRMGVIALIVSVLGAGATLMIHSVQYAALAAIPVAMCGLFSLVLSGVFAQAVAYKQENDLTV